MWVLGCPVGSQIGFGPYPCLQQCAELFSGWGHLPSTFSAGCLVTGSLVTKLLLRWYLLVWIGSCCCLILPQPAVLGQGRSSEKGYLVPPSPARATHFAVLWPQGLEAEQLRNPDRKQLGELVVFLDVMTNAHQKQLQGGRAHSGSQLESTVHRGGNRGRSVRRGVTWDPESGSRERDAGPQLAFLFYLT